MSQMNTEKSFVDLELENVTNVNPVLEKINKLVKWDRINKKLISKYKKSASADGRPAYPAIVMFNVLLLQRMYNLIKVSCLTALTQILRYRSGLLLC